MYIYIYIHIFESRKGGRGLVGAPPPARARDAAVAPHLSQALVPSPHGNAACSTPARRRTSELCLDGISGRARVELLGRYIPWDPPK